VDTTSKDDPPPGGFPDWLVSLICALKKLPGCIGVRTAVSSDTRLLVFAWFTDRAAARDWYFSEPHADIVKRFLPDVVFKEPLRCVGDASGPLLVIASFLPETPDRPDVLKRTGVSSEGEHFPFSEAAIELYQPVPGGPFFGGKFAPSGLNLPFCPPDGL
jgi:hypothetical protein